MLLSKKHISNTQVFIEQLATTIHARYILAISEEQTNFLKNQYQYYNNEEIFDKKRNSK